MKLVSTKALDSVSGGFGEGYQPNVQAFAPLPAVPFIGRAAVAAGVGAGVFNMGADAVVGFANRVDNLGAIGARIGEAAFEATHPNQMGQMVFTRDDFKK